MIFPIAFSLDAMLCWLSFGCVSAVQFPSWFCRNVRICSHYWFQHQQRIVLFEMIEHQKLRQSKAIEIFFVLFETESKKDCAPETSNLRLFSKNFEWSVTFNSPSREASETKNNFLTMQKLVIIVLVSLFAGCFARPATLIVDNAPSK